MYRRCLIQIWRDMLLLRKCLVITYHFLFMWTSWNYLYFSACKLQPIAWVLNFSNLIMVNNCWSSLDTKYQEGSRFFFGWECECKDSNNFLWWTNSRKRHFRYCSKLSFFYAKQFPPIPSKRNCWYVHPHFGAISQTIHSYSIK